MITRIDLSAFAPEEIQGHTSKGDQPKWICKGRWYKADHMGYEALSEVVISRLLEKSNIGDYVLYEPALICYDGKETAGCVSDNFRSEDEILVPFEKIHRAFHGKGLSQTIVPMETAEKIRYTADFIERTTGIGDAGSYLTMLLELDSFFLNEDRHTNNLAVIRSETTHSYRLCPVFDNGLSLLSDMNDYPLADEVYSCISRVKAKPFSQNFDEQVSAAEQLFGPQLKLGFTKNDVAAAVEDLRELYSDDIIRRVEKVLLEQMRRYPVYF